MATARMDIMRKAWIIENKLIITHHPSPMLNKKQQVFGDCVPTLLCQLFLSHRCHYDDNKNMA